MKEYNHDGIKGKLDTIENKLDSEDLIEGCNLENEFEPIDEERKTEIFSN